MKQALTIVKIGGKLINDEDKLTTMSEKLGIETKMFNGRRITDAETLKLVIMVYAGGINKRIVAQLQKRDVDAIGLSGADANIIKSHKRVSGDIDYGFAGDIDEVNVERLTMMLSAGLVPVLAPITHDKNGLLLNTNADTIAAMTSSAFASTHSVDLKYCFEFPGVMKNLNDLGSVILELSEAQISDMVEAGILSKGMLPKIHNGFHAKASGVENVWICGTENLLNSETATSLI